MQFIRQTKRLKRRAASAPAFLLFLSVTVGYVAPAQNRDSIFVQQVVKEATTNSQLQTLGHQLVDVIGPRLVGTPQMDQAHDWAVKTYAGWGIAARNEKWGEWRGWERGATHVDMVYPRVKSLEGMQLAWSPSTKGKTVTAETIILADVADSVAFKAWLPSVKGKFVMISMVQPTGRPDYNWQEFATKESFERMKKDRDAQTLAWRNRLAKTGLSARDLALALENAGAAGVIQSLWSNGFGVNKIFGANTKKVPTIDLSLEDYGMLFRLTESGQKPRIAVRADSKERGLVPTFNTMAEIKGTEKPDEYVMLSAHFDSWDGSGGATDNATGTLVMMEAMRLLKKFYPNPKRTILVGHWGSEEQGLNGSRAFVEDHPEIVQNLQALFNQDNGTGRVVNLSGQGFLHSYDYLNRWLSKVPDSIRTHIQTSFPGSPSGGGSDFASFVAVGAPGFSLSSLNWSYGSYTWHTNRDSYDKIVWDDVRNNAILTAIMVYMASEDPQKTQRDKIVLPVNANTGQQMQWPAQRKATRKGGVD
ncbi:M20/M25/M40 family metallo-hydrolase [Paracnuella aquatica]|uniref:M20/M25/M40 family metallo-hydrolase n=1 Tax=Paracnuella aquatica TaxID=2268757 RepID=UPI000DEEAD06|nr:M20/M25/M40 family metallo-hydrolase [Paracnuella aquatica]RPD46623.1 M20/M25/M40 family metallo-hydrolase [Paracnuella aquatica]